MTSVSVFIDNSISRSINGKLHLFLGGAISFSPVIPPYSERYLAGKFLGSNSIFSFGSLSGLLIYTIENVDIYIIIFWNIPSCSLYPNRLKVQMIKTEEFNNTDITKIYNEMYQAADIKSYNTHTIESDICEYLCNNIKYQCIANIGSFKQSELTINLSSKVL